MLKFLRILEKLKKFSLPLGNFIRNLLRKISRLFAGDTHIAYIFSLLFDPRIDFIIVSLPKFAAQNITEAFGKERIKQEIIKAKQMKKLQGVNYIQFIWNDGNCWEPVYMTLENGDILGEKKQLEYQTKRITLKENAFVHLQDEEIESKP